MVFKLNCIMMVETRILTLCRRKVVQLCFIMSPGKIIFAVLELLPVSPVPPYFMIFGIRGQVTDVMSDCVKLLVNRFRGYWVLISQNCHFPFTCCVALTTVHALPCDTVINASCLAWRQVLCFCLYWFAGVLVCSYENNFIASNYCRHAVSEFWFGFLHMKSLKTSAAETP